MREGCVNGGVIDGEGFSMGSVAVAMDVDADAAKFVVDLFVGFEFVDGAEEVPCFLEDGAELEVVEIG